MWFGSLPAAPGAGPSAVRADSPGFGGKRFHLLAFADFVPGCSCSELGFNFPAPAASLGSPAGGAESERWKRERRC